MTRKKIFALFLSTLMICSLLAGCGASSYSPADGAIKEETAWSDSVNGMDFVGNEDYLENDYGVVAPESPSQKPNEGTDAEDTESYLDSQKLIYTCTMSMETLFFDETTAAIKDLVKHYGGFIESDTVTDNAHNWYYDDYYKDYATLTEYVTIRIPSKNYEAFLNGISEQGKVTKKSENVDNITKTYNDTATVIATLEKEETMLLGMMDKCVTIDEMITVETRLSAVSKELAVYRQRMESMDMDIAFSTVILTVEEVVKYTPEPYEEPTYLEKVGEAIVDSAEVFLDFLADLSIALIYSAPFLVLFAVIILIIVKIIKACIKKNTNKTHKPVDNSPYVPKNAQNNVTTIDTNELKSNDKNN